MADVQLPESSTRGRGRGRPGRGYRGRGSRRGGRGGQGPASGAAPSSEPAPPTENSQPRTTHTPHAPSRRRGGRGRGRGGIVSSAPTVGTFRGPQRTFGGHLSSQAPEPGPSSASPAVGLNVNAAEFVPGGTGEGHQGSSEGHRAPNEGRRGRGQRSSRPRGPTRKAHKSTAPDLPTRIHEDIDNRQYECIICTEDVTRTTQVWTCDLCWAVLHRDCARQWHKQETTKSDQRREEGVPAKSWKCPACNSRLEDGIGRYHCWCGKDQKPNPVKGIPPHSCGQSCSKPRETCPHPCALTCHAGPCPPCTASISDLSCYCGKAAQTKRCLDTAGDGGWSCGEVCDDFLSCGEHQCPKLCHTGLCGACEVRVDSRCYCGKSVKEMLCEERVDKRESFNHGQAIKNSSEDVDVPEGSWFMGSFECGEACGRPYDCGEHKCEKSCHPQDEDCHHCPLSPDVVSRCPCGKTPLSTLSETPRTSCTDEIPRCDKVCRRSLPCGHECQSPCHAGPCKPCLELRDVACRCGRTSTQLTCTEADSRPTPRCSRPCKGSLNCRRHFCEERCCPMEKQAKERMAARKQQRRQAPTLAITEEVEEEHTCERVCGRALKCGNHFCAFPCHSGPCPSCMEAIWEDVTCACGLTVLEPPQPCGTKPPDCRYSCVKQPTCGHPPVEHACHPEDTPCPPCTHLVEKPCICGKKTLKNQRCWFNEGRCGLPCGKKLKCGAHFCQKTCHRDGECEDADLQGSSCNQLCGRTKQACGHACRDTCHEPSNCNEQKPCGAKVALTCECNRLKKPGKCLATETNPTPAPPLLPCDEECARQKRVAQLRDAFDIGPDHTDEHVPYSDTTLDLFQENQSWAVEQESELRDFAADAARRVHRLKPMPPASRAFVHSLAKDFGLASESQDLGINRAVTLLKTPTFVSAPLKSLSASLRIRSLKREKEAEETRAAEKEALAAGGSDLEPEHFNALVLSGPAFALTVEDLEAALKDALDHSSVVFKIEFPPGGAEVILKAASRTFADAMNPANVHETLTALRPGVADVVSKNELAAGVQLAHVDEEMNVLRRERVAEGGWSEVVRKGRDAASSGSATPAEEGGNGKKKLTLKLGGRVSSGLRRGRDRERIDWMAKMRESGAEMG